MYRALFGPSLVLAVVTSLSGCSQGAQAIGEGVLRIIDEQESAWNRGDIDGFMDGYSRSERLSFSSASGTRQGWSTVRQRYFEKYPDSAAMGQVDFTELKTTALGSDAALVTGRWQLARESGDIGGVFSLVFRREIKGWRIIHDHTSAFPASVDE